MQTLFDIPSWKAAVTGKIVKKNNNRIVYFNLSELKDIPISLNVV